MISTHRDGRTTYVGDAQGPPAAVSVAIVAHLELAPPFHDLAALLHEVPGFDQMAPFLRAAGSGIPWQRLRPQGGTRAARVALPAWRIPSSRRFVSFRTDCNSLWSLALRGVALGATAAARLLHWGVRVIAGKSVNLVADHSPR